MADGLGPPSVSHLERFRGGVERKGRSFGGLIRGLAAEPDAAEKEQAP